MDSHAVYEENATSCRTLTHDRVNLYQRDGSSMASLAAPTPDGSLQNFIQMCNLIKYNCRLEWL